jgi:hypothetical protein
MTSGVSRSRGGHARYSLQLVSVAILSLLWMTATNAADSSKAWRVTDAAPLAEALLEQANFHGGVIAHVGCEDGQLTAAVMQAATDRVAADGKGAVGGDVLLLGLDADGDGGLSWRGQRRSL